MLLQSTVIYKPLVEGTYTASLTDYQEITGKEGKDNYVQLTFTFPNGRKVIDNIFASSLPIALSQLNQQLNPNTPDDTAISAIDLLEQAKTTPITLYISYYRPDETTSYRNINFLPPVKKETNNQSVDEDF